MQGGRKKQINDGAHVRTSEDEKKHSYNLQAENHNRSKKRKFSAGGVGETIISFTWIKARVL